MNESQNTIKKEVTLEGIGIHTGERAKVKFKPAGVDKGIKFVRVDLPEAPSIPADIDFVSDVTRGTTLQNKNAKVQTIEHLMATLYGLGIDNVIIEIDKSELPVGDGSAKIYTDVLLKAGLKKQKKKRKYFKPTRVISYRDGNTDLVVIPSDKFTISSTIHYTDKVLRSQFIKLDINRQNYIKDISPARTYCFETEIGLIKGKGLGKGGSFENTIVVGEKKIENTKLRFEDEFVRHKVLDLLGDLSLLGKRIKADVIAVKCGHASNIELTRRLKKNFNENENAEEKIVMDIDKIMEYLPHRYPFLLVDKIIMDSSGVEAQGFKNITVNEPFLKGHFPGRPIFPSSLVIEFMAQSSAVMFLHKPKQKDKLAYFLIIKYVQFFSEVKPLDLLRSEVELVRAREKGGKVSGESFVGNKKVAEAEFVFSIVDK
ncbi:MAG: UDP-3-O-acyl-N-acetylglucosamine deacetylase [Elusimicrobiota bacterium]